MPRNKRVKLVGESVPFVGKTLWEILGNLKNFGVGRLIVDWETLKFSEPSFFKIIKVQPLPVPRPEECKKGFYRDVSVWVEEIYRGKKMEDIVHKKENFLPKFMLIPKCEEEKYYKLAEEYSKKDVHKYIPKYMYWPPLYKILWESKNSKQISNLNTVLPTDKYSLLKLEESDKIYPKPTSYLYKLDEPVENMIKEIIKLQKIIDDHSKVETN